MENSGRTRYLVIVSVLVTAVGLGTGLVAYYATGVPLGSLLGRDGPIELRYVPRDAVVVAYAEVREIMTSEVRQRLHRAAVGPENGQRQFQEQTGIDIESDIDRVVGCLEPGSDGNTVGLVLARGRFSDVKIEALMREHGAQIETYQGKRIISSQNPASSPDGISVSFLEPGLAALGSPVTVRRAIDLQKSGDDITRNDEMMGVLRSIDRSHVWVVGRFDALGADKRLPADVARRLPAITWFSLTGRVDSSIHGVLRADSRDEAAANNLRDVVRGFLALARLQAGGRPEFQALTQSLDLGGTGKSVTLSFTVPGELLEALPSKRPGGPPPLAH